jgi:hypothetical protein
MITFNIIQSYTYGSSQLIKTQFKNLSIIQSITHDGFKGYIHGIYIAAPYIAAPWIHMDPIHHKSTTNSIQILIDAEIPTIMAPLQSKSLLGLCIGIILFWF